MGKIEKIDLKSLRNDEHFQFGADFIALVKSVGAEPLKIKAQFDAFLALHTQEDEALKKITKSALTEKIAEADRERDTVFTGLADAVRSGTKHFSLNVREAAARLQIVFDTYGNLTRKAIAEETSAVYNLLRELTDHHAADAEALDLNGWIAELDRRNVAVEKLMDERYDESAARSGLVLKEVRALADEAYRTIAERVDALQVVEGDVAGAPWAGFILRLNAIIDRANNLLARRRSGKKEDEQETPEQPETTEE